MKLKLIPKKPAEKITVRIPEEFGAAIRNARKAAGLTQADVAALCQVGTRFLSDLENGKASIQLGKALQVLRALGLTLSLSPKTMTNER